MGLAASSDAASPARARDFRLDFFRGLSLFFIFIDHIPDNPVGSFTLRGLALCDAAEVFIFISGYTVALVYGQVMLKKGAFFATAMVWRRAWQLYLAHIFIFVLYSAQVAYTVRRFANPLFSDELGVGSFLTRPDDALISVLMLRFQPALLDILPLYIALLLTFPVFMVAMRRSWLLALAPSALIWFAAYMTEVNLPGGLDGEQTWFFNPFAWQFLFVIGACMGFANTQGHAITPAVGWRRTAMFWAAAVFTLVGMVLQVSWTLHQWNDRIPGLLFQTLFPIHKTLLPPLRIAAILSLVALVGLLVRRDAPFMTGCLGWLVVLCGQNSLQVFCLTIVLSLLGNIVLTFISHTVLSLVAVNVGGVLIMIGLGALCAWYKSGGHMPRRPRSIVLLALLCAAGLLASPTAARTEGGEPACEIPEGLALHDLALPAARAAVAKGGLTILVVGGAAMSGAAAGDPAATLPTRLRDALAGMLPTTKIDIINAAIPRNTVEDTLLRLPRLLRESGARLVIWSTGAREVAIGASVDAYIARLETGMEIVHTAGADLIMVDMQYAPSIAHILNLTRFHQALIGAAEARNVPMLERYEMMRYWTEHGVLDLDTSDPEQRRAVARRLFACLADALAAPIAQAVR